MGNAKVRRLCEAQNKWTDKSAPKHKHKFTKHATMRLYTADGFAANYDTMFCEYCHSFKCIFKPGNASGIFLDSNDIDTSLPLIVFKTSHNFRIGFSDLIFVSEGCYRP